jgi:hypothetical protein
MTDQLIDQPVRYGSFYCYYCYKRFSLKVILGSISSISLEEQAKYDERFVAHLDEHSIKSKTKFEKQDKI